MAKKKKDWVLRVGVINEEKDPKVKELTKELDGMIDNVGESLFNSFSTTEKEKNDKKYE